MRTITIKILEPKAMALLQELENLNLIKFQSRNKSREQFDALLERVQKEGGLSSELIKLAESTKIPDQERLDISMKLYAEQIWSRGEARQFCGLNFSAFRAEQAKRKIPIHYGLEELDHDLEMLKQLT